eukprot:6000979-Pyramimonas_sp.AAC.1
MVVYCDALLRSTVLVNAALAAASDGAMMKMNVRWARCSHHRDLTSGRLRPFRALKADLPRAEPRPRALPRRPEA